MRSFIRLELRKDLLYHDFKVFVYLIKCGMRQSRFIMLALISDVLFPVTSNQGRVQVCSGVIISVVFYCDEEEIRFRIIILFSAITILPRYRFSPVLRRMQERVSGVCCHSVFPHIVTSRMHPTFSCCCTPPSISALLARVIFDLIQLSAMSLFLIISAPKFV